MSGDDRSDAALVAAVRDGDADAYGVLFERWFDRVYDVARNIVRNPDTAADVAQDTFISAWERLDRLENVEAFGGWLLRSARNRALDRLEREGRSRPQADDVVTGLHDRGAPDLVGSQRRLDTEELIAGNDRDGLIGAAAVALGERDASILDLQLRHGLSAAEIADELGVTPNNAHQLLFRMRNKLGDAIGAYILWQRGRPVCATLRADVASIFDVDTFAAVERHRRRCDECTERRAALVAPEQLFSAAPMLVAPLLLRTSVRDALRAAGVPVSNHVEVHRGTGEGGTGPAASQHPFGDISGGSGSGDDGGDGSGDGDRAGGGSADGSHDLVNDEAGDDRSGRRRIGIVVLAAAALLLGAVTAGVVAVGALRADPAASVASSASGAVATSGSPSTSIGSSQARSGSAPAIDDTALVSASTAPGPSVPTVPSSALPTTTPAAPPSATNAPENQSATTAPSPPANAPQTTAPPLAVPPPTAPPTAPPATSPPATAPPSTAAPTTVAPPAAPSVVELFFSAPPTGVLCPGSATPRKIGWLSDNATSATLAIGASTRTVPVNGQLDACAGSGDLVTLTVSGPGGADSSSIVAP